ncbi:hypothetical protein C2S51_013688 [Perilla frutescens var. frutescens]|nr:hypothetical protein C2S51_013688 [Perilla frutescens var. frutescens]
MLSNVNVLIVTFPGQAHINPALQLAKNLAKRGVSVTFLTSLYALRRRRISSSSSSSSSSSFCNLIDFVSFSDGYDDGWSVTPQFVSALRDHGSKAVEDAVAAKRREGRPFTRLIYTLSVPWAGAAAHRLDLPATLLWIQPAILFGVYFHYFNNNFDAIAADNEVIDLPGLPVLERRDLPSFLLPSTPSKFVLATFKENFENLDRDNHPTVLVNSFDALEAEALRVMSNYCRLMAVGPLIPSAYLDGGDDHDHDPNSDVCFGGDLIPAWEDYEQYLDSKEEKSLVYVAFGSYTELSKPQMEEIAKGLITSGKPFLWVIRGSENKEKLDQLFSCREELEKQGKIVGWCNQLAVLAHPCVGCFVTHCGWNSTLESIASGVPMVLFPQWTDQATNAKLIQDFWRTGVRVMTPEKGGPVEGHEMKRCIEIVMAGGERGEQIRREAKKWRDLGKGAMKEDGGPSHANLHIFIKLIADHEH